MRTTSGGRSGAPRIALLWHRDDDETKARRTRLDGVFRALAARAAAAEPVVYADENAGATRERLLGVDGVLVWVNPITGGRDRTVLDALLREVAGAGVWVSAHPDVVSALGTKEVLYRTRALGWGSDVRVYDDVASLRAALPSRLVSGPLVLKRARGNAGLGVWKVEDRRPGHATESCEHRARAARLRRRDGGAPPRRVDRAACGVPRWRRTPRGAAVPAARRGRHGALLSLGLRRRRLR